MYDELIKRLMEKARTCDENWDLDTAVILEQAADAIEDLTAKVKGLQFFADNILKLPDCNTCLKKNMCEFMPKYGEYCRINCPAWLGKPPKEENK